MVANQYNLLAKYGDFKRRKLERDLPQLLPKTFLAI
jgi:hypothetical protein